MTERQVLFNLTELIFVCDSIVLNIDLSFFPLSPNGSYATTSFFVSTTVFLNHGKFSVNVPLKDVIKLNKLTEMLIFEHLWFLSKYIEVFNKIFILKLVFCDIRDNVGDDSLNFFNDFIQMLMFFVLVNSFEKL